MSGDGIKAITFDNQIDRLQNWFDNSDSDQRLMLLDAIDHLIDTVGPQMPTEGDIKPLSFDDLLPLERTRFAQVLKYCFPELGTDADLSGSDAIETLASVFDLLSR